MTALLDEPTVTPEAEPAAVTSVPRRFRPDVEGLRAVAVGLVVLFHAGIPWLPGGYVGVDVFFVISGFLITGLLLREFETEGRIGLIDFYARRARRILPLASVVIIATVGASSILLTTIRMASIPIDGIWSSVFAANFRFANSGANYLNATAAPSPLQHFWSLAVEEQFYVVWPALLWFALHSSRRSGGRARVAVISALAVTGSLFWCIHQTGYDANTAYFSPFTRAWELGIGALVAVCGPWLVRLPRLAAAVLGWVGLAMIVYGAVRFDSHTAFPGSAALVPVLGAGFVIAGGLLLTRGGPERVLTLKPMRLIGKFSFGLYLWHWPILIIAEGHVQHLSVIAKLVLVVLAGLLSALTFYRLENVIRTLPRLVKSPSASLAVGLLAVSASLVYSGFYVVGNRYVSSRAELLFKQQSAQAATTGTLATPSSIEAAVAAAATLKVVPATVTPPVTIAGHDLSPAYTDGCLVTAATITSPSCTFGNPQAKTTVVLFGDSKAAQWMPALQNSASRANFKLVVLTKGNCTPASVTVYNLGLKRSFTECDRWRSWAIAQIRGIRPALVVMSDNFHGATLPNGQTQTPAVESAWEKGLATTFAALKPAATRLVMIADVASHNQVVPDCLAAHLTDAQACSTGILRALLLKHQAREAATAKASGVVYLDPRPWFCTSTMCPSVIDGIVTDFDENHMTATYSRYLGHAVGLALGLEAK